jgi:hypothetical protein
MKHRASNRSKNARYGALAVATEVTAWLCSAACVGTAEGSNNLGDTADALADVADSMPGTLEGVWIGEAQRELALYAFGPPTYVFPSGSTQVRLEFRVGTAKLTFGQSPAPPVTRFDVGYPLGVDYIDADLTGYERLPPVEGAEHDLFVEIAGSRVPTEESPRLDADVQSFFFFPNGGYAEWCDGQVPFSVGMSHDCVGALGRAARVTSNGVECLIVPTEGATIIDLGDAGKSYLADLPVDCGKLNLCSGPNPACVCSEYGCYFNPHMTAGLVVARIDDELVGLFTDVVLLAEPRSTTLGTVRFRRVSD